MWKRFHTELSQYRWKCCTDQIWIRHSERLWKFVGKLMQIRNCDNLGLEKIYTKNSLWKDTTSSSNMIKVSSLLSLLSSPSLWSTNNNNNNNNNNRKTNTITITICSTTTAIITHHYFFFRLLLSSCFNWKIYRDDHSSLHLQPQYKIWIISYIFQITSLHGKIWTQ